MAKRTILSVSTPLGYRVTLSRDRWREIIRFKHPALTGKEKDVRNCLQDPLIVRESLKDAQTHLYYNACDRGYLCVVTAPSTSEDHFVVTCYFTREIKQGTQLWKR